MILHVKPAVRLSGEIILPSSKSYTIRALLIAACGGSSTIIRPSDCDDALVALNVAKLLGARIIHKKPNILKIEAHRKNFSAKKINVGESGTVLRLLLPLLACQSRHVTVTGVGTLKGRPNSYLIEALRRQGVNIKGSGPKASIPIHLKGGTFRGGRITIDASLSSQFISALLIACPQLEDDTELILKAKIVSSDYITMTQQILKQSGIQIKAQGSRRYFIKARQVFGGLKNFKIPSDYGLAAFPMAAAALTASDVTLKGHFDNRFVQADGHIFPLLRKMGVRFTKMSGSIRIQGPFQLRGGRFSLKDAPDLVPIVCVLALFARGVTHLTDIKHARVKESDRISDLKVELLKIGARIGETENGLTIYPSSYYKKNSFLDPHHDHRLAMAFSVLGLKLGVTIKDIECVRKSYPGFVKDLQTFLPTSL